MEEVIDLIATDSPASQVTDKIKELLFAKAAEKVDAARPIVATSLFGGEGEEETDTSEDEE